MTDARAVKILRAVLASNGELDVAEDVARELMRFCLVALEDREALVEAIQDCFDTACCCYDSDAWGVAKRHMRGKGSDE